jgi:hypothetical protein
MIVAYLGPLETSCLQISDSFISVSNTGYGLVIAA